MNYLQSPESCSVPSNSPGDIPIAPPALLPSPMYYSIFGMMIQHRNNLHEIRPPQKRKILLFGNHFANVLSGLKI